MSLSLDGRLPSGRRANLLRHIAECEPCAQTWAEMKTAQGMVLGLPRHQVRGAFQQSLQHRIEAGEGTPDAVYGNPVTGLTRARYLLSGAAAAALVIVALRLFDGGDVAPSTTQLENPGIARTTDDPAAHQLPDKHESPVESVELASLNEYSLARNCMNKTAQSANRLRARMDSLGKRPLNETWDEIEDVLVDFKAAVGVLQWMDRKRILTLPRPMQNEFREAGTFFDQIFDGASWEVRGHALQRLQKMRLERVRTDIEISCCRPAKDLFLELGELVHRMPEARKLFQIDNVRNGMVPGQRVIFLLRIETNSPTGN